MLSAILSTYIKLPVVIKTFVLSIIFKWPFYTGLTVTYLDIAIIFYTSAYYKDPI